MNTWTRFALIFAFAAAVCSVQAAPEQPDSPKDWPRGIEQQRRADMGNGFFLNPIIAGDHPDPSVLKDGDEYYMVHSSFTIYPGLVVWHSRDLVNWQPVGPALFKNVGSVWAPDIAKHKGRYYIYFPGKQGDRTTNFVVWADDIRGPWSDPIDLKIGRIDPGHVVGPDGRRYLFMSGAYMVPLSDDGLSVIGEPKQVYSGWDYPDEWVVESRSEEGPKLLKRGEYYYMVFAQGGTAGPATSHMVVVARAKNLEGPWVNAPNNPIMRTMSTADRWWSKGHATPVEGPDGKWYMVYHAYENGFYNLGRHTLLEEMEWTDDGWIKLVGYDVARPMPKPKGGEAVPHGFAYSDDFSTNKMGIQWSFYHGNGDASRFRYENGTLVLKAQGTSPRNCSPLGFVVGDHAYEVEVEMEIDPETTGGLLMFYSDRLYAGLGYNTSGLIRHRYGLDNPRRVGELGRRVTLRLVNDRHIVSMYYKPEGGEWKRLDSRVDVSGYNHNTVGEFLSVRPSLYASGKGEVRFRNFRYRALP